jgi:hypothetical protein
MYTYDYTTDSSQVYGEKASYKKLAPGKWGIPAGDINADGLINMDDKNDWRLHAGLKAYKPSDINMDSQVNNADMNELWLNNFSYSCQVPE